MNPERPRILTNVHENLQENVLLGHFPSHIWNDPHVIWNSQTLLAGGLSDWSRQGELSVEALVTVAVGGPFSIMDESDW